MEVGTDGVAVITIDNPPVNSLAIHGQCCFLVRSRGAAVRILLLLGFLRFSSRVK